jgi:uncharacterized protein (TIGR02466 family)
MKLDIPFYVPFLTADCEFFGEIKDELIENIMKIHNKDPFKVQGNFPKGKTLKGNLTESVGNFFDTDNKNVVRLRKWITSQLVEGYKGLKMEPKKIFYTNSWFHVTKKGGFHSSHIHPNTPLAGIFYVKDGNSDVGNNWINPISGFIDFSSKWCNHDYENKFVSGRLVLFPGWVLHSAPPHDGDDLRIVIAFNSSIA